MSAQPAAAAQPITPEFIAHTIEIGSSFALVAAAEYAAGDRRRAREAAARAETAHDEALQRIRQAEGRGLNLGSLRERLRDLADRLAGLAGESL
jgi:hypothetical protein